MTISLVNGQQTGTYADNATTITLAYPGNVTAGNLLIVAVWAWNPTGNNDPYVVTDISKSAGTATLGSFTLDTSTHYLYTGSDTYINTAIFSVPVTGTGSCTIQVAGAPAGSYIGMGIAEVTGIDVSASRVEDSDVGSALSGSPTTANVTSAAGAIFIGCLTNAAGAACTITPDAPWQTIYEEEDASAHEAGSMTYQIVSSGTTDAASWTQGLNEEWTACVAVYKEGAAGPLTVNLNAAPLATASQAATVVVGAVSVMLSSASLSAGAQAITIDAPAPGAQTVNLSAANLSASAQTVSIAPGNISVSLNAAALTVSPQVVTAGGSQIVSLNAAALSASGQAIALSNAYPYSSYWLTSFDADQEVYATFPAVAGNIALWARLVNPTGGGTNLRGYYCLYDGATVKVYRYNDVGAVNVQIGTWTGTLANGNGLWMALDGASVKVYKYTSSWALIIDETDADPALDNGYIGMSATDPDVRVDDFGGGELHPDQSVSLSAAGLTAGAQGASILAGAATVNLNVAQVTSAAQGTSIVAGAATASLNAATLTAGAQSTSIVTGAVSLNLNAATLSATAQGASIVSGAVSLNLNAAGIATGAQGTSVTPGAASVLLNAALVTSGAQGAAVDAPVPGALTVNLNAASITSAAPGTSILAGAVAVSLNAASITSAAGTVSVVAPLSGVALLNPASLGASAQGASILAGAVSVLLNVTSLSTSARPTSVDAPAPGAVSVSLNAASLSAGAQGVSIAAGAVSISLNVASLSTSALSTSIGAVTSVALAAATLSASPQALSIATGAVTTSLNAAALLASAGAIAAISGLLLPQVYTALVFCNLTPTISINSQPSPVVELHANPTPREEVKIG